MNDDLVGHGSGLPEGVLCVLEGVLRGAGVVFSSPLRVVAVNHNVGVTDGERVWVKVSRSGGGMLANELRFVTTYRGTSNLFLLSPIVDELVAFTVEGMEYVASVWVFEPGVVELAPEQFTPAILTTLVEQLQDIHSLPVEPRLPGVPALDSELLLAKVGDRVEKAYKTGYVAPEVLGEFNQFAKIVVPQLVLPPGAPLVLTHGDAHLQNTVQTQTGNPVWVDYESVRYAPPEWDAAALNIWLHHYLNKPHLWDHVTDQWNLNPALLNTCKWLKAISNTSYLLTFETATPLFLERKQLLETGWHNNTFPARFPMLG